MSAFDPKRTSASVYTNPAPCQRASLSWAKCRPEAAGHEAARVHHANWWCGSGVAAHRARATARAGRSNFVGTQAMSTAVGKKRRNWSRSRPTSSWRSVAQPSRRCCRRPARCRSCSCTSPIRLVPASAAKQNLPAIYTLRSFSAAGGLLYYGINPSDQYPRAASYVDQILRGEKPGDLPVQAPTKFQLVINLKAAKALAPCGRGDRISTGDVG